MPKVSDVYALYLQLDLITDLLGTPSLEAMRTACEGAKAHILRGPHKQVWLGMPDLHFGQDSPSISPHQSGSPLCRELLGHITHLA